MTFNQIVWKMAKVQYKKYTFYYLCNSFAVMFFFMFATVYFNDKIEQAKKLDGLQNALSIPGVALILFTVFFISYAYNVFMKRRKSEFGLFMTLGMSKRDLSQLLLFENGIIGISSILTGLLAGTIFSRLFFMLLMSRVGLQEDVSFHFNGKMFSYSIGMYLVVFSLAVGKSLFQTIRSSLISSINSNRFAESIKMRSPILGAFGILLMACSLLILYFTYEKSAGGYLPLWTMAMFIGLYISLNQFTSFFIHLAKKFPGYYYRRLLFLSSLDYKLKKLTSIIMLVTVMTMITIFYSTLLLTFYKASEQDAMRQNPYDVAFFQTDRKNTISEEELNAELDIKKHQKIPVFYYYKKYEDIEGYESYAFMSVNDFNKLTSKQKTLKDDEYLFYVNTDPEYSKPDPLNELSFTVGNEKVRYSLSDSVVENHINLLPNAYEFIIVSDVEFRKLRSELDGFQSTLHLINVTDWKTSGEAVGILKAKLEKRNAAAPPVENLLTQITTEQEIFRVQSKIEDYQRNRNENGLMFFVTTFLSIMFFFGTFVLLYLNLFSEIDLEKAKYKKLYKIGMTTREVRRNVAKELRTFFFVPISLGTILAFLYIVILSTDVGGILKNLDILKHFILISGIYFIIQTASFYYAKKKMIHQLL
ncbi:ABC transporter permease [Bacillus sp. JJ1609]|uniref:ABC transporter permease n=1 Tax=Bacillus sp. JJ1609 TaxID=3122977 RepID=UPI002FFFD7AE